MPLPRVVNVKHLGIRPGEPLPPGHIYIGHRNQGWGLKRSRWANPYVRRWMSPAERVATLPDYETFLRRRPDKLERLPDLATATAIACWCAGPEGLDVHAPLVCHGQIMLRLLLEKHPNTAGSQVLPATARVAPRRAPLREAPVRACAAQDLR